jgi:hypothetical protein
MLEASPTHARSGRFVAPKRLRGDGRGSGGFSQPSLAHESDACRACDARRARTIAYRACDARRARTIA